MSKSDNLVLDLLEVPGKPNVRQRKASMDDNRSHIVDEDKQAKGQGKKTQFKRSNSIDSGVFLTPPSSPRMYQPLPQMPCSNVYGQQGASLAFCFILEQEMGLEKLKQE